MYDVYILDEGQWVRYMDGCTGLAAAQWFDVLTDLGYKVSTRPAKDD